MVVIHVKKSETDQFLYETNCSETNDALIEQLVHISNTRVRLRCLAGALRQLAEYGPMKPMDQQGLDEIKEEHEGVAIEKGEFYKPDPTGMRTGNGVGPTLTQTFEQVCADAEAAINVEQVRRRVATTQAALDEKLANCRGAVTMAYPMGLPEWDTVRLLLEGVQGLEGSQAGLEVLEPAAAELWGAGKEFRRGQLVADRVGRNEKTKLVAKLQKPGDGPPAREAAVSEEERKAMMAFYFKKQEELKRLAEADDDDYLNSAWADPKQLQKGLRGVGAVRAPGVRKER
ncbi:unnamed protein product [Heterosigma akashiwo]|uniref:Uncharacterized protein n=1 Tax=Heterosigma akashiwo TaxID=2829 RepID=A0A6V1QYW4_HETAK|mmetsp:Transcript_51718/g.75688  ORF Transcript_51718/g.75688 Transcript_51718/m.75688 type:complete len:287 (+) Transcript_51718:68-928(+)